MAAVYDNWDRLVGATLRREQLRLTALRTPSDLSSVSLSSPSPSYNFSSQFNQNSSSFNSRSLLTGDSFSYHQILKATDFLNDSNVIKNGHSGDIYYGVLESGIQVVVKKINLSSAERELQFKSELEMFGIVNHYRLVPFLGYCLDNIHEKFLVYKYAANKDLSCYLQREFVPNRGLPSLDWATRLKIATATAEALCYLHHECFPPLVHRDIQASSILLDDDFEVRLGSLTAVCIQEKNDKQKRIARLLQFPKGLEQSTSGSSNASCAYDVYCFGKILLELVSGKLGASSVSDSSMRYWMTKALPYVFPDDKKIGLQIVDPSLLIDEHHLMEIWSVTFIAKVCLSSKPSKRPKIAEVLKALEYLSAARFSTHGNVDPGGHPDPVPASPPMVNVPEGSKLTGLISQVMTNTTSSGSIISSGNDGFPEAIRSKDVYQNGKILASPNLRIFTSSELQDATKNFRTDAVLGDGESGRLYKGSVNEKVKSRSGSETIFAVIIKDFTLISIRKCNQNFKTDAVLADGEFGRVYKVLGDGEFGRVYKGSVNKKFKPKSASESLFTTMQESQDWQEVFAYLYHPSFRKHMLLKFKSSHLNTRIELEKIMDPRLEGKYSTKPAIKMAKFVLLCLQYRYEFRPSIKQVVDILEHIESADKMTK